LNAAKEKRWQIAGEAIAEPRRYGRLERTGRRSADAPFDTRMTPRELEGEAGSAPLTAAPISFSL